VARIVRQWRLVRPGRLAVPVRLVAAAGRGVRLEVAAGAEQLVVAWCRFSDGRWRVHLPLARRTVLADSWSAASWWMLDELYLLLPGRLILLGGPNPRSARSGSAGA
jgi:hypothetical protein